MMPLLLLAIPTLIDGGAAPLPPTPPPVVVVVPAPAPIPTTVTVAAKTPQAVVVPGHYVCPGGQDVQYSTPCAVDVTDDPGPNNLNPNADPALPSHGDTPGGTLGSLDAAYGEMLVGEYCAVRPDVC